MEKIPDKFPFPKKGRWDWDLHSLDNSMEQFKLKDAWNDRGMYAFVCWEWVEPLAKWIGNRKVLEVMAGAGWLARALREKEVCVIATDDYTWADKRGWTTVTEVEKMDAVAAIEKYGPQADTLIISWPYMDKDAFHAITKWHEIQPDGLIIYIGEDEGGCTACIEFFVHFEYLQREDFEPITQAYATWWGLHDNIVLGKYKP